ncbi:hypothetical protein KP509_19G028000 [Ceratopteris richardii]|uniref:Secreted protein n=1 Tax=Ceratopteris richardii TaxID=49495 RepID=A0A8T2SMZ0_CERRI|nr:hypothetical protein KP509_19G027800 [Ceratopteris richardii]KAH7352068.1 hypothetical protein KP509_19G028000 [Ceratopteris richardii]
MYSSSVFRFVLSLLNQLLVYVPTQHTLRYNLSSECSCEEDEARRRYFVNVKEADDCCTYVSHPSPLKRDRRDHILAR